jgi:hypothetical protein
MSAWNYSKKHQEVVEIEEISTALSEKKRCKYFCFLFPATLTELIDYQLTAAPLISSEWKQNND